MPASLDPRTSSQAPSSSLPMQSRRGEAIVLIAVVIWSTTPVFIDHLQTVDRLSPLQVSTWRALLVTLLLALYLLVRRPCVFKLQRREIGYYVLYGVVGIGLFNLCPGYLGHPFRKSTLRAYPGPILLAGEKRQG